MQPNLENVPSCQDCLIVVESARGRGTPLHFLQNISFYLWYILDNKIRDIVLHSTTT